MTLCCRYQHLWLKDETKEPSRISLIAWLVQPGVLKHFPIQMVLSQAASGQTRGWGTDFKNWGLSWVTSTSQLTQGRYIDSSGVPFHKLLLYKCCQFRNKGPNLYRTKLILFWIHGWYKLQSAQKPDKEKEKKIGLQVSQDSKQHPKHLTCLLDAGHLGSYRWRWDCLNVGVCVNAVPCGEVLGGQRAGKERSMGCKSRIYFREQAGVMLSLGVYAKVMDQIKMQVGLIIFSNYIQLNWMVHWKRKSTLYGCWELNIRGIVSYPFSADPSYGNKEHENSNCAQKRQWLSLYFLFALAFHKAVRHEVDIYIIKSGELTSGGIGDFLWFVIRASGNWGNG